MNTTTQQPVLSTATDLVSDLKSILECVRAEGTPRALLDREDVKKVCDGLERILLPITRPIARENNLATINDIKEQLLGLMPLVREPSILPKTYARERLDEILKKL